MLDISTVHPMQEYLQQLNTSTTIYIDRLRLQRALLDCTYRAQDLEYLCKIELRKESGGYYYTLSKDNIIEYLCDLGVEFTGKFLTPKGEPSLDLKKVVEPLLERDIGTPVLSLYKEQRSFQSYYNTMKKLFNMRVPTQMCSDGKLLLKYPTHIDERENLRVYYSDIAAVSIPKIYSSIVTSKGPGYHIAWGDFPQADWRYAYNLFIKDETNEKVMENYEDAYEGLARIVEGANFDTEKFKETRKAYKVDCLSIFYNSNNNKPIPTAMRKYFRSRKKYSKYLFDLAALYRFDIPIPVTSYFGYTQLINSKGLYESGFLSKCLNTPIQTFTSHVVNETVLGVLHRFWELGYTQEDINVYYVRHDEPIFMFRDTIIPDAWVFKDCSEIHIDGFTPLHLDFHFGNYYQEEDSSLTIKIQRYMNAGDSKLHTYPAGTMHEYSPVPTVEYLYMLIQKEDREDAITYKFLDMRTRKKFRFEILDNGADPQAVVAMLLNQHILDYYKDPAYLLIANNKLEWVSRAGSNEQTFLKVIKRYDEGAVSELSWHNSKNDLT